MSTEGGPVAVPRVRWRLRVGGLVLRRVGESAPWWPYEAQRGGMAIGGRSPWGAWRGLRHAERRRAAAFAGKHGGGSARQYDRIFRRVARQAAYEDYRAGRQR